MRRGRPSKSDLNKSQSEPVVDEERVDGSSNKQEEQSEGSSRPRRSGRVSLPPPLPPTPTQTLKAKAEPKRRSEKIVVSEKELEAIKETETAADVVEKTQQVELAAATPKAKKESRRKSEKIVAEKEAEIIVEPETEPVEPVPTPRAKKEPKRKSVVEKEVEMVEEEAEDKQVEPEAPAPTPKVKLSEPKRKSEKLVANEKKTEVVVEEKPIEEEYVIVDKKNSLQSS